jgi:tRNA pseudouridine38-40 synthase
MLPCACGVQVQGSGFLYKQVRHMTGVLLAVGQGKFSLDHVQALLEMGNSKPPGRASGLKPWHVREQTLAYALRGLAD